MASCAISGCTSDDDPQEQSLSERSLGIFFEDSMLTVPFQRACLLSCQRRGR